MSLEDNSAKPIQASVLLKTLPGEAPHRMAHSAPSEGRASAPQPTALFPSTSGGALGCLEEEALLAFGGGGRQG